MDAPHPGFGLHPIYGTLLNLHIIPQKEVTFVYQKLLLFLSKPQAWYIITL